MLFAIYKSVQFFPTVRLWGNCAYPGTHSPWKWDWSTSPNKKMLVKQAIPIPNLATFKTVGWHSIMILIMASSDPYRVSILPFIQQITRGPNWSLLNCSRTVGLNVSWGTKLKDQIDMAVHLSDGGIIWVFLQKSNGVTQPFNKNFSYHDSENLDANPAKMKVWKILFLF